MENKIELLINSSISEEELNESLRSQLNNKEKVEFAIDLGIDGDLNYELLLLRQLCIMISETYPVEEYDELMTPISKKLLELKILVDESLKYP